jgi:hypothetical protein
MLSLAFWFLLGYGVRWLVERERQAADRRAIQAAIAALIAAHRESFSGYTLSSIQWTDEPPQPETPTYDPRRN